MWSLSHVVTLSCGHSLEASQDDILVLDVEGTDSAQRGEGHAEFESKVALHTMHDLL